MRRPYVHVYVGVYAQPDVHELTCLVVLLCYDFNIVAYMLFHSQARAAGRGRRRV
jgi:hypothetical protein